MSEAGEAIVLTVDELQGVIGSNQALGDVILRAFLARRAELIGLGSGMRLVGSRFSADTRRLREFVAAQPAAAPVRGPGVRRGRRVAAARPSASRPPRLRWCLAARQGAAQPRPRRAGRALDLRTAPRRDPRS